MNPHKARESSADRRYFIRQLRRNRGCGEGSPTPGAHRIARNFGRNTQNKLR
jgi:hypothetical protein